MTVSAMALMAQPPEGRRGGRGGFPRFSPLFAALDADKDGEVSASEMANATKALLSLDADGDGALSMEEMRPRMPEGRGFGEGRERGPGPGGPSGPDMVAALMEFDANKDGKLSKDELPERMQGILARGDSDKDGMLSKEELTKLSAEQRGGRPGGPPPDPIRNAMDTDKDGTLSKAEIANAAKALKSLDKDNDGKLSAEEVRPAFPMRRDEGAR
jgi:Ca2+-binding EF-hand superfamily protein